MSCHAVWGGAQWIMLMLIVMRTVLPILQVAAGWIRVDPFDWIGEQLGSFLVHIGLVALLIWGGFF